MNALQQLALPPASQQASKLQIAMTLALPTTLLIAIFARMMTFDIRKDEQLYAPPGRLLDDHHLYADFFYNHVPGSAWLFHGLMVAMGTDHLLLAVRLAVFGAWLLFAVAVVTITFALTRSAVATVVVSIFVLSNDLLLAQTGMAGTNNLLPLPFAYLGMGLFLLATRRERARSGLVLAAGLMLALAASLKINFVAFIPPVVLAAFFVPREIPLSERIKGVVLPLAVGGLIGSLPILYYLVTDPSRFSAHVIGFHTGQHVAYWRAQADLGEEAALSFGDKAKLAFLLWSSGTNLLLLFVTMLAFVQIGMQSGLKAVSALVLRVPFLMVAGTFLLAALLSFLPTPSFPGYFAPPFVSVLLLFTLIYGWLSSESQLRLRPAWLTAAALALIVNAPRLLEALPKLASPSQWTVSRVHAAGVHLADAIRASGAKGKVATLAPIYPLEGKLPVYLELATGPFAYRSGGFAYEKVSHFYKVTSPTALEAMLATDPPAAVLVGFDSKLDEPFVHYAEANNYMRMQNFSFQDRYGTAILYVRQTWTTP